MPARSPYFFTTSHAACRLRRPPRVFRNTASASPRRSQVAGTSRARPDDENQEAGLRLDLREAAVGELDSGTRAIVPGRPDESEMIARITSTDPDLVMPPPHTKVVLSDHEKRILTEWVAAGAAYAPHWAFVPPQRPEPPAVENDAWVQNPIDRFVRARREAEGLSPAGEADRATLCRRVSLDLVGLPPTPEELEAFLSDTSENANERLVDRLLASPR